MARGMNARSLGRRASDLGAPLFALDFTLTGAQTVDREAQFSYRVLFAQGIMLAAGTAGDTCVVQRVRGGTAAAITDTAALNTLVDTDQFDFTQINDANYEVLKGDLLRVVTAAGPATNHVHVNVYCVRI